MHGVELGFMEGKDQEVDLMSYADLGGACLRHAKVTQENVSLLITEQGLCKVAIVVMLNISEASPDRASVAYFRNRRLFGFNSE